MAQGTNLDIGALRSEDYFREFQFMADDEPIDITGWIFGFCVASSSGLANEELEVTAIPTEEGSVLTTEAAQTGIVSLLIKRADLSVLSGDTTEVSKFAFNLIATDQAGIRRAEMVGQFILELGA